ncbi:uncharacterized protein J8A68_003129 [[Candida] subhashii]|uniref:UDENN domain-containing protein n=1 Tax=[Candida] subhashii TaxID=561895 RepID=A0A8J5QF66_9ASCO|nr:uncharacterized protein J8A68_003129 [[Candida] subhashii]KAG7663381.1 hypothetical protein J8A68_003129 [[Candida] subhashii]
MSVANNNSLESYDSNPNQIQQQINTNHTQETMSNKRNSGYSNSSTDSGEPQLRPLRLSKQRRDSGGNNTNSSTGTPSPLPKSPLPKDSFTGKKQFFHEPMDVDFQPRPIRLGSRSHISSQSVNKPAAASIARKQLSANPDRNSTSSDPVGTSPTSDPSLSEEDLRKSRSCDVNAITASTTTSTMEKRKSIKIKMLPIEQQNAPIHQYTHEDTIDESTKLDDMIFAVCLVDFHHQRGPEIQWWKSNYHPDYDPSLFKNIPFLALPDGSHLFEETFSNFNLVYDFKRKRSIDTLKDMNEFDDDPRYLKTLFGCSCVQQVRTSILTTEQREENKDITRSIVQKAIVIIVRKQPIFIKIKEKLSIITKSYFQQDTLHNFELLEDLFDNLNNQFKLKDNEMLHELIIEHEQENFINLNLKSSISKFKLNFMIIYKALLLDKKIIIYSNTNLQLLTQFQNNLISLIPNLINNLDNSGCPLIDYIETNGPLTKPTSLNTVNRLSMLRFFGLPLQIFNTKNSFWNPYLPLQQLDELSVGSFMIGCSNLLIVNQAKKFDVDILIDLDTQEVTFPKTNYKPEELRLSTLDKRFINHLINTVQSEPRSSDKYIGSDDYIRYQFEDYLNSLISTMRFSQYVDRFQLPPPGFTTEGDKHIGNTVDFNPKFIEAWKQSQNFKIWNSMADDFIFNFIDPKHVSIDNIPEEPTSINKNISNFFNSFKFKETNSSSTSSLHEIKAQKFIPKEQAGDMVPSTPTNANYNNSNTKENESDDGLDELVAGFERVRTNSTTNSMSKESSPSVIRTPTPTKTVANKIYNWAWGQPKS